MSQETDLELLKRGRQGDDEAFGRFRERHLNSVTNVLRRFFRDENDIDLFTNATFAKLFTSSGPSQNNPNLASYVKTAAFNTARDEKRRKKREQKRTHNAVPLDSISKKEYSDIEIARRDEEYLAALEVYLNLLTPKEQPVLLHWQNGLSYAEIAKELGITVTYVGRLLHSARAKIREFNANQEGHNL